LLRIWLASGDEAADDVRDFHDKTGVPDCEEDEVEEDCDFCETLGDLFEKEEPAPSVRFVNDPSIISRSFTLFAAAASLYNLKSCRSSAFFGAVNDSNQPAAFSAFFCHPLILSHARAAIEEKWCRLSSLSETVLSGESPTSYLCNIRNLKCGSSSTATSR
jgi:hypothetical protein